MLKKIISAVLILVLTLSWIPAVGAAEFAPYYIDVTANQWYYDEVARVSRYGYMEGIGNQKFAPQSTLTRGMTVTILGRIAQIREELYTIQTGFTDVSPDRFYGPYVAWAAESGVTKGMTETTFAPDSPVTREQMAAFIARFADYMYWTLDETDTPVAGFRDQPAVSNFARGSLELMRTTGIIQGDTNGNFNPQNPITRAETAAMISRLIDAAGEQDEEFDAFQSMKYIIHTGGTIDNTRLTNSLDAFENALDTGNRLIEIDFAFTSDGYPVCVHDWNYRVYPDYPTVGVPTLDEYLQCSIYSQFTPMWMEDVVGYMTDDPDLYVITDTKFDNVALARLIANEYPDLMSQFIIQVYSEEEYYQVYAMGFDHIIFTLYKLSLQEKTDPESLVIFAQNNPLFGYTFPYELCSISGYVDTMLQTGVPLFIHTVNDLQQQKNFYKMGISGIYTDNTIHE